MIRPATPVVKDPRAPVGYPADVEAATKNSGGKVAVGRGHGFTWAFGSFSNRFERGFQCCPHGPCRTSNR
jgi:hypothetical protein